MKVRKGEIVNKSTIIKPGEFTKEEYEGLLAASDSENGIYNIALQLNENLVMIVDQVSDSEVQHRYHQLAPDIQKMQKEYKENNDLKYI